MGEPFLGEIKIVSFGYAPRGWALANGQALPINQNQALFSLFGTMYGGNGQTTFAIPNLRGRVPAHFGGTLEVQGQSVGEEFHTLITNEMPEHLHTANGSSAAGNAAPPGNNVLASTPALIYNAPGAASALQPATISNVGGNQPHENRQPFLTLNFCVALQGIFPSQN